MKTIIFIILLSINAKAYDLDLYQIQNQFDQIGKSQEKCSDYNYEKMKLLLRKFFVVYKFQSSLEKLNLFNGVYDKASPEDKIIISGEFDMNENDALNQLDLWYNQNCTLIGKVKTKWKQLIR